MTAGCAARGTDDPGGAPGIDIRLACLAIDLVDELARRGGFDPAELVDPNTGAAFGPILPRIKAALLLRAALGCDNGHCAG